MALNPKVVRRSPWRVRALLLVALAGCASCSVATAPTMFTQTISGTVSGYAIAPTYGHASFTVSLPPAAQGKIVLTWSNSAADLDLYVLTCPEPSCSTITQSTLGPGVTTEQVTVSPVSYQTVTVGVENYNVPSATQSFTLTVQ